MSYYYTGPVLEYNGFRKRATRFVSVRYYLTQVGLFFLKYYKYTVQILLIMVKYTKNEALISCVNQNVQWTYSYY